MNPDRRVIRCIALAADWIGLAQRSDFRQYRRGRHRFGLPVECALIQLAGIVITHQQVLAINAELFRFLETWQRQARLLNPTLTAVLEQVQLGGLGVKRHHTARYQRHSPGFALGVVEQGHRGAFDIGFRVRRVGPPADVFFIHHQLLGGVIHLAELRRRWQRQAAYTLGFGEQRRSVAYQPLLALALLAHQEHKQIGRPVAVQAQAIHRVIAGGQVQRLAKGLGGRIEADQQGLLAVVVEAGHQHLGTDDAGVEAAEIACETGQFGTVFVEQLQAVAGAGGQAFAAVGQEGHGFGIQAGCPRRQRQVGGHYR